MMGEMFMLWVLCCEMESFEDQIQNPENDFIFKSWLKISPEMVWFGDQKSDFMHEFVIL